MPDEYIWRKTTASQNPISFQFYLEHIPPPKGNAKIFSPRPFQVFPVNIIRSFIFTSLHCTKNPPSVSKSNISPLIPGAYYNFQRECKRLCTRCLCKFFPDNVIHHKKDPRPGGVAVCARRDPKFALCANRSRITRPFPTLKNSNLSLLCWRGQPSWLTRFSRCSILRE